MAVRESAGEKTKNVVMRERADEDWDALEDFAYEIRHTFEFDRRVNEAEARTLIDAFFIKWKTEHPHDELRYFELRELSSSEAGVLGVNQPAYETTVHITHHSPSITLAAIITAVSVVLAFVAAHALEIAIAAALVIGIWAMWKLANYYLPEEQIYRCPKDGEEFESYENFATHFKVAHPDQEVPPKPTGWADYLKYGIIGIGAALAFRIAYPAIKGR